MTTTLLVPVLNELESMKVIMPQIERGWVDQILVLDGGSTDGSAEWARSLGYDVYVQTRRGLRRGYQEVLPRVWGDTIILFSPDGNSVPEVIPQLVAKMAEGKWDMVIASRYLPPAVNEDDDLLTAIGNRCFTFAIRALFGFKGTDALVIFRAVRKSALYEMCMYNDGPKSLEESWGITTWGVSWEPQMSMRFAKNGLRIAEIPGDEPKRIAGVRKMMPFKTGLAILLQMIRELRMPLIKDTKLSRYQAEVIKACDGFEAASPVESSMCGWNGRKYSVHEILRQYENDVRTMYIQNERLGKILGEEERKREVLEKRLAAMTGGRKCCR